MQHLELALLLHLLDGSGVHTRVLRALNEHRFSSPISPQPGLGSGVPPIARVQRGPSEPARCASPPTPLGHGLIGSPTAPVERAQPYRARSGSTGEPSAHDRTPMMMNQQPLIPDPLEEIRG